ncbi:MAG: tetratricopeptide repeat protein [Deltaproteobacteria bacterium]|jgi:tetratricopeptide (TPR) repeat protein|nr:tetratricopeptide repeat protein [Deltaproteobacteria bacterium]
MSYIHEALKKAQVERDLGKGSYSGIPVPGRKKSFFTVKRTLFLTALLLMVLLAFAGYSWWDQTMEDRGQKRDDRGPSSVIRRPSSESGSSSVIRHPSSAKRKTEESGENLTESYQTARAFHREGRLSDAGIWYEKVISMDPGHVEALNNRGVLHLHKKNYSAARKCFEKAIRLKPDYVDPYYNLACVSAATGQVKQGLRYLGKAISMDPGVKGWAQKDPDLDPLRASPRFKAIVTSER